MATPSAVIRGCLLYEYKLGTTAAEAARKICRAFGEDIVRPRTAQKWFRRFASGDETLTDAPREGRPTVVADDELRAAVEIDSRQTCQELAQRFHVSAETIRLHLHRLGKTWKLSKWVPHELSTDQKQNRLVICTSLLSRHHTEPFLDRVLTCDEKWIAWSNNKRSHHWLAPAASVPPTPKPNIHGQKTLLSVWWTTAGIVHYELLPPRQTITAAVYSAQLQRVHDALLRKQPALVHRKGVVFLQDNARPHTARVTRDKIHSLGWELLPHPAYSPDIAPSDYHLFLALDNHMRNRQLRTRAELETEVSSFFASKDRAFFQSGIYKLVTRWERVIECNGRYVTE